jgi:hypothetical protein
VPLAAHAQQAGKVYRIGYIQTATPDEQKHLTKAMTEGLRELGYVEDRNFVIVPRFAWENRSGFPLSPRSSSGSTSTSS